MKVLILTLVLLGSLAMGILAEPVPDQANVSRYHGLQYLQDDVKDADEFDKNENLNDLSEKNSAFSGRLFMRKFSFSNLFGQKQPIFPIIITGGNSDSDVDAVTDIDTDTNTNLEPPTYTDTVTGETANNAPGDTITNTDINTAVTPTTDAEANPTNPNARIQLYRGGAIGQNGSKNHNDKVAVDAQALAAALSVGGNSNRSPVRIILGRRGSKRGQSIRVQIPAKYSGDFQNDQFILINSNRRNRPPNRRVIRKRKNRRGNNKNKNRRRRITAP